MFTYPLHLRGLSGQVYTLNVANLGHSFGPQAGIYALLGRQQTTGTRILYIGQTSDASDRPGPWGYGHHVHDAAQRNGLAAVGFLCVPQQWQRNFIERDLVGGNNPPLNKQLKNPFGLT